MLDHDGSGAGKEIVSLLAALGDRWRRPLRAIGLGLLLLALAPGGAPAGTLVINADTSNPAPRAAWEAAVEAFAKEHPEIEVRFNVYDHESYKRAIRNWLTGAAPDVVYWFAGQRMKQLVVPGLIEDVSDLFAPEVREQLGAAAVDLVTVDGRQYGVPYTYYHWGFYYRRDLFEQAGIEQPPATWGELIEACERLKGEGLQPIAIGSKDLWPTAGWFDYINLRHNGYDFHTELMGGRVPYTDERVVAVFERWRELIERDCFVSNHVGMSWQESQALLYGGRSAMMLIGNFITAAFPGELRDRMGFFPFPEITPGIGRYEDAPMNSVHIPANARNKADARTFLAFVARADVQERINQALLQLPVNRAAAVADDRFLRAGQELLQEADALAQFFDRETSEDLASVAMKGFQEFMVNPERRDGILATIERARQRIYGS